MNIILILLQSLDGYIAKDENDDLSWGTKEDKQFFRDKTKEIGTMVMGRKTFESMPPKAFSNRHSIVLTRDPVQYKGYINNHGTVEFFSGAPEDLVENLEGRDIKTVALIGGGAVNTAFLEAGLVTELYITIAPVILGSGIKGLGGDQNTYFNLVETWQLSTNEVVLHYSI